MFMFSPDPGGILRCQLVTGSPDVKLHLDFVPRHGVCAHCAEVLPFAAMTVAACPKCQVVQLVESILDRPETHSLLCRIWRD